MLSDGLLPSRQSSVSFEEGGCVRGLPIGGEISTIVGLHSFQGHAQTNALHSHARAFENAGTCRSRLDFSRRRVEGLGLGFKG